MEKYISVVIPLYNKENTISNSIESILSQNYSNWELIIVDDGSTDSSRIIVERYLKDKRIKYYYKKNEGPSAARNYGVEKSTRDWIIFLDADDKLLPNAMNIYNELINNNSEINIFVCNFYNESKGNLKLYSYKYRNGILKNNFFAWIFGKSMPRAGACIINKKICKEFPYNKKLRRFEDAEVIFKIKEKYNIYTDQRPVMIYNQTFLQASKGRKNFNEDYVSCININNDNFWERMAKYDLLFSNYKLYKKQLKKIYTKEIKKKHIYIFLKICHKISTLENKIYQILRNDKLY